MTTKLSVNVDHVATLRQARGAPYPDPVAAARIAEAAGASGITAHLRADRRHIQDRDVARLREAVAGKLNLELSTEDEMLRIALEVRPDQVTLVPERPDEVTTEGGLDLCRQTRTIERTVRRLMEAGVAVSLFLDPDPAQIDSLAELRESLETPHASAAPGPSGGGCSLQGFEINTDAYTKAHRPAEVGSELEKVRRAVEHGAGLGFHVYAGHGLTMANVGAVAALEAVEELNIGHALVSRAVLVGMRQAVEEMLAAMENGAAQPSP